MSDENMENNMITVNAHYLRQLLADIEKMKDFILCHKIGPDPEGELSDWAKKEIEEAMKEPVSECISSEDVKEMILKNELCS
jgi:hypothetical protein